jgi:O-antigen/teichoic acid export membrane protein
MSDATGRFGGSARIGGGLIDAGAAAMATFLASAFAVRALVPDDLGAHALMFSAVMLIMVVPERLVFLPTLTASVGGAADTRLGYYREGLRLALPLLPLVAGFALVALLLPDELSQAERVALTFSGAAAAVFQAAQLFARQILHYADRSRAAIGASILRLGTTAVALAAFSQTGLPLVAVPLAALAAGNAAAAGWAAFLRPPVPVARLPRREIYRRGSYLVASSAVPAAAGFITANLVIAFGGAALLGFAEAARVVAQPVFVGATGLSLVIYPRVMSAAVAGDSKAVSEARRVYLWLLWVGGLGYAALLALPGLGSVVESLLPNAFEIGGLIAVSVVAQIALATTRPYAAEALALGREPAILVSELPGALVIIGFGFAVPVVGAFAIPGGLTGAGFTRTTLLAYILRDRTQAPAPANEAAVAAEVMPVADVVE